MVQVHRTTDILVSGLLGSLCTPIHICDQGAVAYTKVEGEDEALQALANHVRMVQQQIQRK
jgi:hypothetical protein